MLKFSSNIRVGDIVKIKNNIVYKYSPDFISSDLKIEYNIKYIDYIYPYKLGIYKNYYFISNDQNNDKVIIYYFNNYKFNHNISFTLFNNKIYVLLTNDYNKTLLYTISLNLKLLGYIIINYNNYKFIYNTNNLILIKNSKDLNSKDSNSKDLNSKDLNSKDSNSKDSNSKDSNSKDSNSKDSNSKDSNSKDSNSKDSNSLLILNPIVTNKNLEYYFDDKIKDIIFNDNIIILLTLKSLKILNKDFKEINNIKLKSISKRKSFKSYNNEINAKFFIKNDKFIYVACNDGIIIKYSYIKKINKESEFKVNGNIISLSLLNNNLLILTSEGIIYKHDLILIKCNNIMIPKNNIDNIRILTNSNENLIINNTCVQLGNNFNASLMIKTVFPSIVGIVTKIINSPTVVTQGIIQTLLNLKKYTQYNIDIYGNLKEGELLNDNLRRFIITGENTATICYN